MKIYRDESGQVMVLTVLCMTVFIGFMALAIDVGMVFRDKRHLQTAADAAATAAALDYFYNKGSGTAISAAKTVGTAAAASNSVDTSAGATITINSGNLGEISTPWHNSTGFFEAILTEPAPTAFMGYFGVSSMTVKARAVAGTPGGDTKQCFTVLNTTGNLGASGIGGGDSTVFLKGSFQVNAANCGIAIDGTAADTLYYNGNGGSTNAKWIDVVGGAGGQVSKYTPQPVKATGVSDPLSAYSVPDGSGTGVNEPSPATNVPTYSCSAPPAGFFTGTAGSPFPVGTDASSVTCYSSAGDLTAQNLQLNGLVIFKTPSTNNVVWGGNISSGTGGTTVDITTGGMTENAGTVFNISAPTTGYLPSVVLAAPTTNTSTMELQFGNSTGIFNGTVYLPAATLWFHDSGGDHSGGITLNINVVVGQVFDQTTTLNVNGYTPTSGPDPLALVALVE